MTSHTVDSSLSTMADYTDSSDAESDFDDFSSSASDIAVSEGEKEEAGIRPYQFEPMLRVLNEEEVAEADDDGPRPVAENRRTENTEWCECGNCEVMATEEECICCKEVDRVAGMMDSYNEPVRCILEHPGFQPVCINQFVLDTAYLAYQQTHGNMAVYDVNQKYRYTGYRQLVRWCWGFLGKNIRVPLPACAVIRIRNTYLSDNFTGFHYAG